MPWPAITSSSSNADTNVAPVRAARSRAAERRLVVRLAAELDCGAVAARRLDLRDRRVRGHEDRGRHAEQRRREGDALRVVAGAGRDDAAQPLVRVERRDPVVRAADLERAGALEVLRLQVDVRAAAGAEVAGGEHRRPHRDLVDDPGRAADVVDRDHARLARVVERRAEQLADGRQRIDLARLQPRHEAGGALLPASARSRPWRAPPRRCAARARDSRGGAARDRRGRATRAGPRPPPTGRRRPRRCAHPSRSRSGAARRAPATARGAARIASPSPRDGPSC